MRFILHGYFCATVPPGIEPQRTSICLSTGTSERRNGE